MAKVYLSLAQLTHWGRVTHICISKVAISVSDNGLSPGRRQAIIWNNAGILLIGPLGTNFTGILIGIHIFSFKKMHLKMASAKWRLFCLGLNVYMSTWVHNMIMHPVILYNITFHDVLANDVAGLPSGPWFNIKMSSCRYRKSHCGDKTVVRSSYLHNGIVYTGKMSSLYWIRALGPLLLTEIS